jgi:hypothetical protein
VFANERRLNISAEQILKNAKNLGIHYEISSIPENLTVYDVSSSGILSKITKKYDKTYGVALLSRDKLKDNLFCSFHCSLGEENATRIFRGYRGAFK